MNAERFLVVVATVALVAGLPNAPAPAARPSSGQALLCVVNKKQTSIGTAKLVKPSAVDNYLVRGACRLAGTVSVGSACDATDPDGDDVCGSDGATCGDGYGPGGIDNPCHCGDIVMTDTRMEAGVDPVASTACAADGLALAAGVRLDLTGVTLTGSDQGSGVLIAHGGEVLGGTVAGFDTGIRVLDDTAGAATHLSGTVVEGNAGDGVVVDLSDPTSRAVLENLVVQGNAGDGVHVLGGPGVSNLDVAGDTFTPDGYGLVVQGPDAKFRDNGAHGLHFGAPAQQHDIAAYVDLGEVNGNGGNGVRVEQKSDLVQGADCGASAGYPGCTGVTLHGLIVHDNTATGVEFHTAFVIPRRIGETFYGLGFTSNKVFHNAMPFTGCTGDQLQPQVRVIGTPGLGDGPCAAATDETSCAGVNTPVNRHCYWTGSTCLVTWDLRGAQDCDDNTANPNQIHSYNTNTDPVGSSELSVGLYASDGALIWADNNSWRTGDESQNVDQDASSFVDADSLCPAGGILLQCSSF